MTTSLTRAHGLSVLLLVTALGCRSRRPDFDALVRSPVGVAREQRLEGALAERGPSLAHGAPLATWILPRELHEISGIVPGTVGMAFAHGDEDGELWELDVRHGILVKAFSLGKGVVKGDFEGITVANGDMYLLTSKGRLYAFREGANGSHVPYTVLDTGLEGACEFEGVTYDASLNSLVLACKHVYDKTLRGMVVLYRLNLADKSRTSLTRLMVPMADIIGANGWKELKPSDITVDPLTGNYVLIASAEKALFVLKPDGTPVYAQALPPAHYQPEGLAITKDSILMISDEGGGVPAMITLYRWP